MASCRFCTKEVPAGAKQCPACQRATDAPDGEGETDIPIEDEVYELGVQSTDIPKEWQGGATYMLELPARCPYCREVIRTVRVLKLKRTQVTFTSTLPRGGRVVVCPQCERILTAELSAL